MPPLTVTKRDIDHAIKILDAALSEASKEGAL
jgi:4-aminobutyrate aminotransferase-like enzyme